MEFKQILKNIKDYVFPVYCLECEKEGEWICGDCEKLINNKGVFCCPVCHRETGKGVCCNNCQEKSFLSCQIAVIPYQEGALIGKMVEALKYYYVEEIGHVFQKMISEFLKNYPDLFVAVDCVVPLPLHRQRYLERGFNQAGLLAEIAGKNLNKPVLELVERVRHTKQQAKLKREQRLKNVRDAFKLKGEVSGKKILLIDDVFTTGSTMQECAKALKDGGASEVIGFTVARG